MKVRPLNKCGYGILIPDGNEGVEYLSLRKRRGRYVDEEKFEHDIIEEVNE